MSAGKSVAALAAKAVFCASLLALGVWLLWYGQYAYGGMECKTFRRGVPGGAPPAWVQATPCALNWQKPIMQANVGFLVVVPAVAALAAIAVIGTRDHTSTAGSTAAAAGSGGAVLQSWGSTLLPPRRFWLWWCDGLTVKDALLVVLWAAFNAAWYSASLKLSFSAVPPGGRSPRLFAKSFASLMMPNLVPLFFPVSRGSVISNALGLSYPDGIRYHRWLGQWALLLVCGHGILYWASWAADGKWLVSAWRNGADTSNMMGGVALPFALLLWVSSQQPLRRSWYALYKALHHIGFWGFLLMGCAHHWALFWYFVPGLMLYAVDGVFRLHQMFAGRSGDLNASGAAPAYASSGCGGVNTEVLRVDVDPAGTMCTLLLSLPEFGVAPVGIVWLNVPSLSLTEWHAFDYTASPVGIAADGSVVTGHASAHAGAAGAEQKTALAVHIKAYSRWTKALVQQLQEGDQDKFTIRLQGPYADPPANIGQPYAVVLVAGGNGIASALPVLEELSAAGVKTQGLPALLIWACRKGHEFQFMAARVLAAARALGLNLTIKLHVTDGADLAHSMSFKAQATTDSLAHTAPRKDHQKSRTIQPTTSMTAIAVATSVAGTACDSSEPDSQDSSPFAAAAVAGAGGADGYEGASAGPTSLCPVVAFASFASQLSFKAVLHLVVFAGILLGISITAYFGSNKRVAAGEKPWETLQLGPALVLISAACGVGLGLVTLWIGLFIQRRRQGSNWGPAFSATPAAAVAAASGRLAHLVPAAVAGATAGDKAAAPYMLEVPTLTGSFETLPVSDQRPSVEEILQGWLSTQQQLPSAATAMGAADQLHCVVYGCGPTPLDHATQLAVAVASGKQRRQGTRGVRKLVLQFVRKAQQL